MQLHLAALALVAAGAAVLCSGLLYLGRPSLAAAFVAMIVGLVVLWRRPSLGFYGVFGAALLFDHYAVSGVPALTARVPLWRTFSGITPAAVVLTASLALLVARRGHAGEQPLLRMGPLAIPAAALVLAVIYGIWRGITFFDLAFPHGFDAAAAANEVGALLNVPLAYLLAFNVVRTRRDVHTALWVAVAALGLKALQMCFTTARLGTGVFSLREIATHEDSLFLSSLVLLALGFWVYGSSRRLRLMTLALLPLVGIALIANHRRTGFVALAFALILCGAMLLADGRPRRWVWRAAPVAIVLGGAYAALFWDHNGPIAYPVYSVKAVFNPGNQKDLQSNVWRTMENVNIDRTIDHAPLLGIGFGRRYVPWIQEPSIEHSGFLHWRCISHNAIYWVWMKMGAVGFAVFWYVIAATIALGCSTLRRLDQGELKAAALMAVGLVAMQVIFSYADLGLTSPRNMAYLGGWMGIIASLSLLSPRRPEPPTADHTRRQP